VIVDRIYRELAANPGSIPKNGREDETMLGLMAAVQRGFQRQFLEREERTALSISGPWTCSRKLLYKREGAPRKPLEPRSQVNFFLGDVVEATAKALAIQAGVLIEPWDQDVPVHLKLRTGALEGHPDAWMRPPVGEPVVLEGFEGVAKWEKLEGELRPGDVFNVEFKKQAEFAFGRLLENGMDNTWGYLSQANGYCASEELQEIARQGGGTVRGTIFVVINTNTGHMAEVFEPFDPLYAQRIASDVEAIEEAESPDDLPRLLTEDETNRGKTTGRQVLGLVCSYCDYAESVCWKGRLEVEFKGTKTGSRPVFVVTGEPEPAMEDPF